MALRWIELAYARLHARLVQREIIERDLALAWKIQRHFLPAATPDSPGYAFAVEYKPALAVGGDLYNFVPLAGGSIAIAVGDVSGKGVSAALFAAKVASDLRYQAAGQTSAAAILARLNRVLASGNEDGMFVTLALAVVDPRAARLTVASTGHPLPLVRDASGAVTPIGSTGDKPLGLDEAARFHEYVYAMDAGDAVVVYTDGVIEALDRANELYGGERLTAAIRKDVRRRELTRAGDRGRRARVRGRAGTERRYDDTSASSGPDRRAQRDAGCDRGVADIRTVNRRPARDRRPRRRNTEQIGRRNGAFVKGRRVQTASM